MKEHFTPEIKRAIEKRCTKIITKNIIKTIIFYVLCYSALLLGEQSNDLLSVEQQAFWIIAVAILIAPLWLFQLHKLIIGPAFYGMVIDMNDAFLIDSKTRNSSKIVTRHDRQFMREVDSCIVTVKSNIGLKYKFVFSREDAVFARNYFSIGDQVYYNVFTKYPISTVKAPPKKYCFMCGEPCADFENECPHCKLPLIENQSDTQ